MLEHLQSVILLGMIVLLAAMSPGPDFFVVVKSALSRNRQSALLTSLGVSAAILVHVSYCVLGLAVVIAHSPVLLKAIQFTGSLYLITLGVQALRERPSQIVLTPVTGQGNSNQKWQAFRDGFLTNLLNPKCTLFILSVFTLVINPSTPRIWQFGYGIEISLISLLWFGFLSLILTHFWVRHYLVKLQFGLTKLTGAILIFLGLFVLFEMIA